jgi:EAL domain-containing protein (putative c-di-GMP-specific phosphodiesterase class I)
MALASLRVMVVEDHGFQRRMALRLLADLGIERTWEAADGGSALELLHGLDAPPDVIIVDLDMPGMDGVEFIGHVAERKLASAVVIASALDPALLETVQTMARAYGLRVLGAVEKPMTLAKLATVLAGFDDGFGHQPFVPREEAMPDELRLALRDGELRPWFQPQAEFSNGRVLGVEALARWVKPDGRVLEPGQFLGVIEREGLVEQFTDVMLRQSCVWKKRWEQQHGLRLGLSVNVWARNLTDSATADRWQQIVREHGVDPAEIVLEVTESSILADAAHGLGVLARLRLKGFGLSIDDFGTGYSSMAQLSHVPFTELKIDRGFVTGAEHQPRKRAVIEASLDLARKLELDVVAEGVETVGEWQMLAELGCGLAQGWLIAKAVPGDDLPGTVVHWRSPGA